MPNIPTSRDLIKDLSSHLEEAAARKKIPIIAIMGPTASGKTTLGIGLATYLGGEIISADSRQIYKKMDIGTAKPTPAEMAAAKHHLVDFVEPDERYNLARYQREAKELVSQIHARGKIPLLVGGTGLYLSSIIQNYELPESKPNLPLREHYEKMAREEGKEVVHEALKQLDPAAAARVHPQNLRYVIRALEVVHAASTTPTLRAAGPGTDRGISETKQADLGPDQGASEIKQAGPKTDRGVPGEEQTASDPDQAPPETGPDGQADAKSNPAESNPYHVLLLSIDWPRQELYDRIEKRIDQQLAEGLLEETKNLLSLYPMTLPSLSSLGYNELGQYLAGKTSYPVAVAAFKQHTRNYAKRQLTWFRRFPNVYSIPGTHLTSICLELRNASVII